MIIYDGGMDKDVYKNVFGRVIQKICETDKDVVYLDCDLMNSFGTNGFWRSNKRQAINCGISEANMIGIAAGLSAGGKKPYVHTFGPFASRRSFDQSFLSVAYAGNSVRIFGSDPGVTAAFNGGTHMPFEDIALMRSIPHSTVIEISDAAMFESLLWQIKDREGLTYIRTSRKSYPAVYSADHKFEIGKGQVVRDGGDIAIIACGLMLGESLKAADRLKEKGISARVVDMFTIKPIDSELVIESAKKCGAVLTAENHNIIGGLGDAVGSALLENGAYVPVKKLGVQDEFGSVGPQDYLQEHYGLTADEVFNKAIELIARKNK